MATPPGENGQLVPAGGDGQTPAATPAWDLGDGGRHEVENRAIDAMRRVCRQHGGPRQYLQQIYSTPELRKQFAKSLLELLPMDPEHTYFTGGPLQGLKEHEMAQQRPLVMHPAMFAFHSDSSIKGNPEENVCMKLVAEYAHDGFLSASDPVFVKAVECQDTDMMQGFSGWTGPPGHRALVPQSIGYQKGSARVITLLALLSFFITDADVNLKEDCRQPCKQCKQCNSLRWKPARCLPSLALCMTLCARLCL